MTVHTVSATSAPSPKTLQIRRIVAAGESPAMAAELARIAYPWDRRDDVSALMAMTSARCSAAGAGSRI